MLKLIRCALLAFLGSFFLISFVEAKPAYIFLANTLVKPNKQFAEENKRRQHQIINVIENSLNLTKDNPYRTIRVRQIFNEKRQLKSVIVYLLSTVNKSVELIRIDLDQDLKPIGILKDYQLQPSDLAQSPFYSHIKMPRCPDETVQFVVGNNFDDDDSVDQEVDRVFNMAKSKGYNPILMNINNQATPRPTVAAYLNWFSCPNVKGFYNESHGWNQGIVLADEDLVYSMVDKFLLQKLTHNIVLFDSCITFHNPLLFSMTNKSRARSQQYIAGMIMLPFGPSERTARCFWENAFEHQPLTQQLIRSCANHHGLDPNGFNIDGNGDNYLSLPA